MQIKIIKPGLLTSVQDLGRPLLRSQAVPVSGAMDRLSARLANKAIGNADNEAVIEFTYGNASFITETDVLIAYTGYGAILCINGVNLPHNRPLFIPSGTTIKAINNPLGARTYLAIAGGWRVPTVLGSKSTYLTAGFGGLEGRKLKANDVLQNASSWSRLSQAIFKKLSDKNVNYPKWSISDALFLPARQIRIVPAQEFLWFDADSIINFLTKPFKLSLQSNRMGFHCEGPKIYRPKAGELLSTAVTMGTIQVTGSGTLILLMADAQTTGGYPRIAQVASVDLPLCAQLKPNEEIYFKEISQEEAETLYLERETHLKQLDATIAYYFLD